MAIASAHLLTVELNFFLDVRAQRILVTVPKDRMIQLNV